SSQVASPPVPRVFATVRGSPFARGPVDAGTSRPPRARAGAARRSRRERTLEAVPGARPRRGRAPRTRRAPRAGPLGPNFTPSTSDNRSVQQIERRGTAALAGLAGSGALTLVAGITHTLVTPVAFPSVAIAQAFVGTASGKVESFFIEHLGHWAARLTLIGSAAVFVLSGALIGLILHALFRGRRIPAWVWWISLLPVWAISVAVYRMPTQFLGRWVFAAVTAPMYLAGGWVAASTANRLRAPAALTDEGRRVV